jgi:isocitrate dehydrogenase
VYRASELRVNGPGKAELVYTGEDGKVQRTTVYDFEGPGLLQAMHNKDSSIRSFAHSCFRYALATNQDLWFSTKDTISKTIRSDLQDDLPEIYYASYKPLLKSRASSTSYTLIDDAAARWSARRAGSFWACKKLRRRRDERPGNHRVRLARDDDQRARQPHGAFEYEAAHGTVTRHYYKYLKGEATSTNPGPPSCLERRAQKARRAG